MTDKIFKQPVTRDNPDPVLDASLPLSEVEIHGLWSVQAGRDQDLDALVQAVFAETPHPGKMLRNDRLRLIYLWPHKAYLLSPDASLPELPDEFTSMMTDISHGFCELKLSSNDPHKFLNDYCSVDLTDVANTAGQNLRCLLGQYRIVLWWDDTNNVHILLDRSYAQSFRDYLATLYRRWSATGI
jgi:sarcosine oxidase gamma subunit